MMNHSKYSFKHHICTKPSFSKKFWIWRATASGNKSHACVGWEIANELAKQSGVKLIDFLETHNVSVFNDHLEMN